MRMLKRKSRKIVIDTCIARSAGGKDAGNEVSKNCRDFLTAVLTICHNAVFTKSILKEWRKHRSRFSNTWLRTMIARKKAIIIDIQDNETFIREIKDSSLIDQHKEAAIKDLILIRAALETDKIIASYDDRARNHYRALSIIIGEFRDVCWVNPVKPEENVIKWLNDGAKREKEKLIGFVGN